MSSNTELAADLARRIDCALGRVPCQLCLRNARVVDVFKGEVVSGVDIFIDQGTIIDVGTQCQACAIQTIDLEDALVAPGFIDAHVHIESSMLSPVQFSRLVAPFGTTMIVADPHEIANVLGLDGIVFMMREAEKAEIDIRFMLPSCVPATPFETSGARLTAKELQTLIDEPRVLGLAEMMNVPGLLQKDPDILEKLVMTLSRGKVVDGHSPLLSGAALSAYAAAGVSSDHECSTEEEVHERISRAMTVFMREGSAGQNVSALSKAVNSRNSRFFCLCTDDASPDDVYRKGHINNVIRRAVQCGVDPIEAIRMATINTAEHFGLKSKGAVTAGFEADLVILDNLSDFNVRSVWIKGVEVARDGEMLTPMPELPTQTSVNDTVNIKSVSQEDLRIVCPSGKARVIGLNPGDLVTEHLIEKVKTGKNGVVCCSENPQLLKLAVIERHHASGNIGLGLVKGFLQQGQCMRGAIGSTIAHDSHNIMVIGDNDADMLEAIKALNRNAKF